MPPIWRAFVQVTQGATTFAGAMRNYRGVRRLMAIATR
jgi:hypothetical protein